MLADAISVASTSVPVRTATPLARISQTALP
jgi:hypothetical protein